MLKSRYKELLLVSHIMSFQHVTPPSKLVLFLCGTRVTASLTSPHTSPLLPSSPPPPSLLSLCNSLHTVQGAHGLDGRPGPVVSGARPVPIIHPSISIHPSLVSLSACFSLSVCLPLLELLLACFCVLCLFCVV